MIPEGITSSQGKGNIKTESPQFLELPPSHLKPPLATSTFGFDNQHPTNRKLPRSPRPNRNPTTTSQESFTFPNSQNGTISLLNSREVSYYPPSPLQLSKIGRTDAIDNNSLLNVTTEDIPSSGGSACKAATDAQNNPKIEMVSTTSVNSSSTYAASSLQTSATNIQNVTAKKRGQVR